MPTQEQILERFKEKRGSDATGLWYEFMGKLLVPYLPFDYIKNELATKDILDEDINDIMTPLNRIEILKEAQKYLSFAWDKCNDQRGISANRSLAHYIEWFWLADEPEFSDKIDKEFETNYHSYGRHILEMIEAKLKELLGKN